MTVDPLKSDCAREIAGLGGLSRADLIERWIEIHGAAPSKTLTRDLLVRGIAYTMQEQQHGGLTRTEKKALAALAPGNAVPTLGHLRPGTRLYRSWRGTTHEVLVLEDGYNWKGRTYASLSEVARAITGTRWSGPRFFGLKA
jgi:hypothetical protein